MVRIYITLSSRQIRHQDETNQREIAESAPGSLSLGLGLSPSSSAWAWQLMDPGLVPPELSTSSNHGIFGVDVSDNGLLLH